MSSPHLLVRAARGEPVPRVPVWAMRQAGRWDPQFRRVRAGAEFFAFSEDVKKAAEATLCPRRFGVDAIILFYDITTLPLAMGLPFELQPSRGPMPDRPIHTLADLDRLNPTPPPASYQHIRDLLHEVKTRLAGELPVIAFAGAPFTVATYCIGTGKDMAATRRFIAEQPAVWDRLLKTLSLATADFLNQLVSDGADVVQLFDSWAGMLDDGEYRRFAQPFHSHILGEVKGVPRILFVKECPHLELMATTGADVVSLGIQHDLAGARAAYPHLVFQGNVDEEVLRTGTPEQVAAAVRACTAAGGGRRHILNLNHGVGKETPVANFEAYIRAANRDDHPLAPLSLLRYSAPMSRTLAIAAALAFPFAAAAEPNLKAIEDQIQKVVDAASPSVVAVVVSHNKGYRTPDKPKPGQLGGVGPDEVADPEPVRRPFGIQKPPFVHPLDLSHPDTAADHLYGSGVVLDETKGLILTPYHLIEGAKKVYVRGAGGKGSYADIHAADAKSDLAVLRLLDPVRGLKAVKIAEVRVSEGPNGEKANLKKGSVVIALGHPTAAAVGEGSASVGWGTLSNVRLKSAGPPPGTGPPPTPLSQRPLHQHGGLIQVDARVAMGATGAAVFNADGELVGLGSSVAAVYGSEVNGGYAIPMDQNYRRVVAVLKEGKEVEYGFLGVGPADAEGGVRVINVSPGCPAAIAGLQPDDILTAVDGQPLTSPDDLLLHVGGALAGNEVTVEYKRYEKKSSVKVVVAKNLNQLPYIASVLPPAAFGIKVDYYSLRAAGGGWPDRNPSSPPPGVLVREVEPGSRGERVLKDAGQPQKGAWLITHVDGKPVSTPKEYFALTDGKKSLKLHLTDPDQPLTKVVVSLP